MRWSPSTSEEVIPGRYFDGVIDEVRISNVARSAQWISTCYNTQMNLPNVARPDVVSTFPIADATNITKTTVVQVTFSEAMDRISTQAAFSLNPSVSGSFTWNLGNTTMTFTPGSALVYSTVYNVTLTDAAKSIEGDSLIPYGWIFTTEEAPSSTWPYVISHVPSVSASSVSLTTTIVVNFSEPMNQTLTEAAFSINGSVTGSFGWLNASAMMFTPTSPLSYLTVYTVTVSTGAMDLEGENMQVPYTWSFTTKQRPHVVNTVPLANAVGVSAGTVVQVTFSEAMDHSSTQSAFSINPSVSGSFGWNPSSTTMTLTPSSLLAFSTVYNVTLTSAATSMGGDSLVPYSWVFTTAPNGTAPYITTHNPAVNGVGISQYTTIYINFSEPMN